MPSYVTHYAVKGRRRTACGRPIRKSRRDTSKQERVSCKVCLKSVKAWRRYCAML